MVDRISVELRSGTDSQAVLAVKSADASSIEDSSVYGPKCAFARTLPVQYEGSGELLIPEPCYWTPELPFLYDLSLHWIDSAGGRHEMRRAIGLRRLTPRRGSLYWDGKRVVLRGVHADKLRPEIVAGIRAAEVALLIPNPSEAECELADLHGVPLVADLRAANGEVEEIIRLEKHPSVAMVLVDGHQVDPSDLPRLPRSLLLAVAAYSEDDQPPPSWRQVVAIALDAEERPPAELASADKPIIAIRARQTYADFVLARAACDQLQASLAPDFDLAGYFV